MFLARTSFVMRVTAVWSHADYWRVVSRHLVLREVVHDDVANAGFFNRAIRSDLLRDQCPGGSESRVCVCGCFEVHLSLLIVPGGLERLNQVS